MNNPYQASDTDFHLKFVGQMTYEHYREMEDRVRHAINSQKPLKVDLAEVNKIDLCGLHLLGLLQSEGVIVASSPVVEQASRNLLATLQSAALGRAARRTGGDLRASRK